MRIFGPVSTATLFLLSGTISGCAAGGSSGIYGWMGQRFGGDYQGRRRISVGLRSECAQVVEPDSWRTVAIAKCTAGFYQVPLPPGRYILLSFEGSRIVDVEPGQWAKLDVIIR